MSVRNTKDHGKIHNESWYLIITIVRIAPNLPSIPGWILQDLLFRIILIPRRLFSIPPGIHFTTSMPLALEVFHNYTKLAIEFFLNYQ